MQNQLVKYNSDFLPQISDLFFHNSTIKNFPSESERQNFFDKWMSPYIEYWNQDFWIAKSEENKLVGYLAGCSSSLDAEPIMYEKISSFNLFRDFFENYPAHFHINIATHTQGQGIGRLLIHNFEKELQLKGIKGVHVVSSAGQENIKFYLKLDFQIVAQKPFKNWSLLFLGKKL